MSITLDFRHLVNVNPYNPPTGWVVGSGVFKIYEQLGTGLLQSAAGSATLLSTIPNNASTSQYKFRWQVGFPQGGSDYSGVIFLDTSGTGFGVSNQGATLKMFTITAYVVGGEIWSGTIPVASAGDWFSAVFDINISTPTLSSLKIFQESVSTVVPRTTRTAAHLTGMRMGVICNWGNVNTEGLYQITADYGNPTIDYIDPSPTLGGAVNITTSGLGTLTGITVGGVSGVSVSAINGDGTFTIPNWVVGSTGVPLGSQLVIATDGVKSTGAADTVINVLPPTDKMFIQLTTVNTDVGYLGRYITGLSVGDQILFSTPSALGVPTGVNFIDDDSGFYSDYSGTQTILILKASTNIVETHSINSGVPQQMTAYVKNASGDFDVAAHWTPNGVPDHSLGDTFTHGTFTTTIPSGKTWNMPAGTMTGTNTSNRARIINNGTLVVNGNVTMNAWNELVFGANSFTDFRNNAGFRYANVSSDKENSVITSGTSESGPATWGNTTYTTGATTAAFSATTTTAEQQGFLDVQYLIIKDMVSVLFGSGTGTNLMNHFRMQNCVFDNAGFFKTAQFSRLANDFIFDKIDIRHSHSSDISGIYFMQLQAERNIAGTPTGIKRFKNVTVKFSDTEVSTKSLRFVTADYFTDVDFTSDSVVAEISSSNTVVTFKNVAARFVGLPAQENLRSGALGGALNQLNSLTNSVYVIDGTDYHPVVANYHWFTSKRLAVIEDNFFEEVYITTGLDGSDVISPPDAGTASIKRNIMVTQNGGAFVNSYQNPTTCSITMEHNTYIAKYSNSTAANPYGTFMRNESNQRFTGGTNTMQSNLSWVITTAGSADGIISAVNMNTTPLLADQIDYMDYNTYYNFSPLATPAPSTLYVQVSITGKTFGDAGYGANDNYYNPQMTNYPVAIGGGSVIQAFAQSKGVSTTKELWTLLLRKNGFNESTRKQQASHAIGYGSAEILTFARNAVTPTNPLLATSAHDGTSRGAVQFSGVDTTPDAFTFTSVTNASASTSYESNAITVSGVDSGVDVPISVSGSGGSNYQYAVSTDGTNYGSFTNSPTNVQLGYKVKTRLTSNPTTSHAGGQVASSTVTIGGVAGTFTVTNAAINTNPIVSSVLLSSLGGQITATDNEGDTLTYTVTAPATNGTGAVNSSTGAFTYTPSGGFTGTDSFTITITDGYSGSSTVVVNIVNSLGGGYVAKLGFGIGIGI